MGEYGPRSVRRKANLPRSPQLEAARIHASQKIIFRYPHGNILTQGEGALLPRLDLGEGHRGGYTMKFKLFVAACIGTLSTPVGGQVAGPTTEPIVVGSSSAQILRTGTVIQLKLQEALSTEGKKLRVGQHFQLAVVEPVMVNGQIVIPVDSPAVGEITEVRNKGMWGKSGHLTASLLYVSVNGRQIRLTGTFDDKGVTGTGGVVAAVVLVPVVGFFTTGTSARVASGSQIKGFIGEDVPLVFTDTTPVTPMSVPVSVPKDSINSVSASANSATKATQDTIVNQQK